jgi:phenylpyruvate tautomerase PptA (4-oxalocrotonate tautomerase family)
MPLVKISIRQGRTTSEKKSLLDAVHAALVEAFKIPEGDRNQRLFEFSEENFEISEGKTDRYTLIEITAFPGRSLEAKRKLYQAISKKLEALEIPPNDVFIVLYEPPLESWGIRGGFPASEVNIGFKLNV